MNRSPLSFFCLLVLLLSACNETKDASAKEASVKAAGQAKEVSNLNPEKSHVMETPKEALEVPAYVDLDFVMGKFEPKKRDDFSEIDIKYADREGRYMQRDAYKAFKEMHAAAKADGISLKIKSAARNFDYQKGIWERKWNGATLLEGKDNAAKVFPNFIERAVAILKYSSMPGSSRHHWGTDIDINSFTNRYFESGQGKVEFDWLEANAEKYGYCRRRPYTKLGSDRSSGYQEEKWHWSYRPVADFCTKYAEENLKDEMITGFQGSEVASKINIKENYILGISSKCKD